MKKLFSLLCLIACVFCFTACSAKDATVTNTLSSEDESYYVDSMVELMEEMYSYSDAELVDMIAESGDYMDASVVKWVENWLAVHDEIGSYISLNDKSVTVDGKNININLDVHHAIRDVELKLIMDTKDETFTTTYNAKYTLAEKMTKAGLNTVIGISVVFVVLILISLLIGCFKYINQAEQAIKNKKENKSAVAAVGVDNAISQIVQNEEEELVDDLELVAVISAAIAAYTGTSADGFVVRSIKKSNKKKWKNA